MIIKEKMIVIVQGRGFHLPGKNMDTDRIIPARYLKCLSFKGIGEHVFEDDRKAADGTHPFDLPENNGCNILVADENFGSGSSREHAVPALMEPGIAAIIGISFADIFLGNALGNGLVCVTVTKEIHDQIVELLKIAKRIVIDIDEMKIEVHVDDRDGTPSTFDCSMPESHRSNLIGGCWDDIVTCLEAGRDIEKTAANLPYFAAAV